MVLQCFCHKQFKECSCTNLIPFRQDVFVVKELRRNALENPSKTLSSLTTDVREPWLFLVRLCIPQVILLEKKNQYRRNIVKIYFYCNHRLICFLPSLFLYVFRLFLLVVFLIMYIPKAINASSTMLNPTTK